MEKVLYLNLLLLLTSSRVYTLHRGDLGQRQYNLSINKLTYESSTINLKPKNFNVTFFYFNNIIRKVLLGGRRGTSNATTVNIVNNKPVKSI